MATAPSESEDESASADDGPSRGLRIRVPSMPASGLSLGPRPADLPRLSALFLVEFDAKAGYTITWRQACPGLPPLDGSVEFKSLPSGLHAVPHDLVYFLHHAAHAGLSAFVNAPCRDDAARNAHMIAVGVLVPLESGRLGRAWRHADALRVMAENLATKSANTTVLDRYWALHGILPDNVAPPADSSASPSTPPELQGSHGRSQSASDGFTRMPRPGNLSIYHPAWSLPALLDTFGPLILPIYRAALLRRRILLICQAPVRQVCDFVYAISVLSNIPTSVADALPSPRHIPRLRPLFTIGIHDIPFLIDDRQAAKRRADRGSVIDLDSELDPSADLSGTGWIACTTDSILARKDDLWDMLVTIPPPHAARATAKVWPTIECPRGHPVRATQRDLRRFRVLRAGLNRLGPSAPGLAHSPDSSTVSPDFATLARPPSAHSNGRAYAPGPGPSPRLSDRLLDSLECDWDPVVETVGWAALAYSGFMWWASAGEQLRAQEQAEAGRDAALLADVAPFAAPPSSSTSARAPVIDAAPAPVTPASRLAHPDQLYRAPSLASVDAHQELAIIAYFHRLTAQLLSVLADVVDEQDALAHPDHPDLDHPPFAPSRPNAARGPAVADRDYQPLLDRDPADSAVRITGATVTAIGLDVWSPADADFVCALTDLYFARQACVETSHVDVCGVRLC